MECSDCRREIPIDEPSYHWKLKDKDIDLCQTCGLKAKWNKLFEQEKEAENE